MHKLIILLLAIFIGCAKNITTDPKLEEDKLHAFFRRVKLDLNNYGNIAIQEDFIKFLGHFQYMDSGGKRYYLLERENITRMVESVTQQIYSDYILINNRGNVVYSRSNNYIFANNIGQRVSDTLFLTNLLNNNFRYYIAGPLRIEGSPSKRVILVCKRISGAETFPGFAILQIDLDKINSLLEENEFILNTNGMCLFANKTQYVDKAYRYFSHLEIDNLQPSEHNIVQINKNLSLIYGMFSMENINWVVVKEIRNYGNSI